MKLAIISDLHCGKTQYRTDENNYNKFEQIGYRALRKNMEIIKREKPDLIINAGDTFDKSNPSVLAMTQYFRAMQDLDIPTMTILGNHDFNFANKRMKCSAVGMIDYTYFADYEIKSTVIDDILFVLMPYIYDTAENIEAYIEQGKKLAQESNCSKKILVTHGITDKYSRDSLINDPLSFPDDLVTLFDLVIIGHIHNPYNYKQGKTLVLSPGAMIDYQAYEDRTGPIILDTDTMTFNKILVKTPHLVKINCTESDINKVLTSVNENIYKITYDGDTEVIDNDLFIQAKEKAVNLVIDVVQHEEVIEKVDMSTSIPNIFEWIKIKHSDYTDTFIEAKEALSRND